MKLAKKILIIFAFMTALALLSSCHAHEWGEWEVTKEASCTEEGERVRVCKKNDKHVETEKIDPAHSFGGDYTTSSTAHWQFCEVDGCSVRLVEEHTVSTPATLERAEYCDVCGRETAPKLHMLSGKKIIFVGNSHTYFGGVVKEVSQSKKTLAERQNDNGYFYQLCRENGVRDLSVTNWTFGGHSLKDTFSGDCQANRSCGNGTDHASYLTDRSYDYVVLQQGSSAKSDLIPWVKTVTEFFLEGNPNTKFIFLVPARAHNDNYPYLSEIKSISEMGITVVDWGDLVYDVYSGATEVPGAKETYTKHSFVISKDDFHPSLLSGYIISVMVYCALTGESAIDQPYKFCRETRNFSSYVDKYYTNGGTNFPTILSSPDEILGLQTLIDQYLSEKYYLYY